MNHVYEFILSLYYPYFSSPDSSRFESLFRELSSKDKNQKDYISDVIYPERIIQGKDRRTSLIIKNIPKTFKKPTVKGIIEKYANLNFFVLSPDPLSDDLLVAYINVINYKSIVPIYMGLRKHIFHYKNKDLDIGIYYSNIQGKEEMKQFLGHSYLKAPE